MKESGVPIGMCGFVNRDTLDDVDVGFAFGAAYRSQGYAFESTSAVMTYGRDTLGLGCIVAITSPDPDASIRLLEKIGLKFERMVRLADDAPESRLFA